MSLESRICHPYRIAEEAVGFRGRLVANEDGFGESSAAIQGYPDIDYTDPHSTSPILVGLLDAALYKIYSSKKRPQDMLRRRIQVQK